MQGLKLAVPTAIFDVPLRTAIQKARNVGADGVQFDGRNEIRSNEMGETARRQLLHYLKELDLQPADMVFPLRHPLTHPDHLDVRIEAIKSAMSLAWELRMRRLLLRIGRVPCDENGCVDPQLVAIVNELAAFGNRVGVTPVITPSGDRDDALQALCSAVDRGPLMIDIDLGGRILAGRSPVDSLRTLYASVGHVTARDAIRDVDGVGKEVAYRSRRDRLGRDGGDPRRNAVCRMDDGEPDGRRAHRAGRAKRHSVPANGFSGNVSRSADVRPT